MEINMTSCPLKPKDYCDGSSCGWYNHSLGCCSMSAIPTRINTLISTVNNITDKIDEMLQRNIQFVI